jgi:hypothetical protein
MGMDVRITPEAGFLRAVLSGGFSLDEAKRTFVEVVQAVADHKIKKILVDGREIAGEPEGIERFYYGKYAAEICHEHLYKVRLVPRFAYVLTPPVLDRGRFGETVARNRGMIVKVFEDVDDALEWLVSAGGSRGRAEVDVT